MLPKWSCHEWPCQKPQCPFRWYSFCIHNCKSCMLIHFVTFYNKKELWSATKKVVLLLSFHVWSNQPEGILFTVDFFLFLFPFNFPYSVVLSFTCLFFVHCPILDLSMSPFTCHLLFPSSHITISLSPFSTISPPCACVAYPLFPSFTLNLRLSQFQMSWLLSCWVTRQTSAPWSLWSLGDASFTDP